MFGRPRLKKAFCRVHPTRKCEYFCRDHRVLMCGLCLKDKHRDCVVADDTEFKNYYAKKIKDVSCLFVVVFV